MAFKDKAEGKMTKSAKESAVECGWLSDKRF